MALFDLFSLEVGIDLGTVNTVIARRDNGVILRESSVVALDRDNKIVAVGNDAFVLMGRTPGAVRIVHPLRDGVVADLQLCEAMLRHFIEKAMGRTARRAGVRAVLCVPGCITEVEKRALEDAARGAGARMAFLLDEPVAAALGAGLPVEEPIGSLVVDIGGGTTDSAVLAMGGVVQKHSIRAGGTHIDEAILAHIKKAYGMVIGIRTAEDIKRAIGAAVPTAPNTMQVRGRDMDTGLPRTVKLTALEVYGAIQQQLTNIAGCVRTVLSETPPELAADIVDYGMCLTGGGSLLAGMADFFRKETGIDVHIASRPLDCVAEGARIAVENIAYYRDRAV